MGFFKTDGSTWVGIGEQNKDIDVTDDDGMATVWVKSLIPGQTIVHCKVMDKYGLPWKEWNVVKQWYSIDEVILGQVEDGAFVHDTTASNDVNTGHTWTAFVGGAKYVYTVYDINQNGLRDDQVLLADKKDLTAVGGMVNNMDGGPEYYKDPGEAVLPGQVMFVGSWPDDGAWYTRYADIELTGAEFWHDVNKDEVAEVWSGLEGKTVYFFNNIGVCPDEPSLQRPASDRNR